MSPLLRAGMSLHKMLGVKTEGMHGMGVNDTGHWNTDIGIYAGAGADIRLGRQTLRIEGNYRWISLHQVSLYSHLLGVNVGVAF